MWRGLAEDLFSGERARLEWRIAAAASCLVPLGVVAFAEALSEGVERAPIGSAQDTRVAPTHASHGPVFQRHVDLCAPHRSEFRSGVHHQSHRWQTAKHRGERGFVVILIRLDPNYGALNERPDACEDVAIGHLHAYDGCVRRRRWSVHERALAFENPRQPMKIEMFDLLYVSKRRSRVNGTECCQRRQ